MNGPLGTWISEMGKENIKTIVQLVLMNETGDSYYRMRWPARDLAFQAPNWRVINLDAQAKERFTWGEAADLLILYQSNDVDLLPLIEKRRRLGKKTLVEYNDNFYDVQAWSPVAEAWQSPLLWQRYERLMKISDGIIVTGEGLRDVLSSHISQRYYIIENHLPKVPDSYESLQQKKTPYISIGWGGSLGHMADFLSIVPVIKEILAEIPGTKLHVMGNETIPSLLELPKEKLAFKPWGSVEEYFRFWEEIRIGIAPLLDTPYNRCRSDIKAVEMSAMGVLPLLSNAIPYKTFLEQTDLIPFESFKDLKELLLENIRNQSMTSELSEKCHRYVSEKRVGARRTERLSLYEEMLEQSAESDFEWPCGCGYYEIRGTAYPQLEQHLVFQNVNSLFKQGQGEQALKLIEDFCSRQPLNSDAALLRLKIFRASKKGDFSHQLQEAAFRFPDDLRFYILGLEAAEEGQILDKWRNFGKRLAALPKHYPTVFETEIVTLFLRQLEKYQTLSELSSMLTGIFPSSARLRLGLAESFRRNGKDKEAFEHFCWLCERKRQHERSKAFLDGIDLKYLEAWRSAIEARVKGT